MHSDWRRMRTVYVCVCVGGLLGAVMESHWGAAGKTVEEWGYVTHHGCVCVSLCEWEENSVWEAVSSPGWSKPDEK